MISEEGDGTLAGAIRASIPVGLVGSVPGTDVWEVTAIVRGELPALPLLPELPARGPGADMVGRTMSLLTAVSSEFSVITTPTGWRLAGQRSADIPAVMRRANSWLSEDLDAAESSFAEYAGVYKVQVVGPWTLAACVELASGDRLLRDGGAVAELQGALIEAVAVHVAQVARRLPSAQLLVQFDEPMLDAVLAGAVSTPSGFRAYSPAPAPAAAHALTQLADSLTAVGVFTGVHTCSNNPDLELLSGTGVDFLSVDLTRFDHLTGSEREKNDEVVGQLWDRGRTLFAGLQPRPGRDRTSERTVKPVTSLLHRLGVGIEQIHQQLVLTPSCGLVGAGSLANVRGVISELQGAARMLRDERSDDTGVDG